MQILCFCIALLNCCTPTLAVVATSAEEAHQIINTNAHINEPATYQAQHAQLTPTPVPGPEPLPPTAVTTKAFVQHAAPYFEVGRRMKEGQKKVRKNEGRQRRKEAKKSGGRE